MILLIQIIDMGTPEGKEIWGLSGMRRVELAAARGGYRVGRNGDRFWVPHIHKT
jgi:hypothetical protein